MSEQFLNAQYCGRKTEIDVTKAKRLGKVQDKLKEKQRQVKKLRALFRGLSLYLEYSAKPHTQLKCLKLSSVLN